MTAPVAQGGEIRRAGRDDIPLMALLHESAFAPPERWGPVALTAMLALEGGFGFLALDADWVPRGFLLARAVGEEAEILTLAVDPEARRLGSGGRLVAAARDEAARRGAACLFLEVSEGNAPARALYASAGAEEVGRRRRYYADGQDALVLRIGLAD